MAANTIIGSGGIPTIETEIRRPIPPSRAHIQTKTHSADESQIAVQNSQVRDFSIAVNRTIGTER